MSRSPLPPVPGETPVKVIFETDDPGANAQQLLMDNQGVIGHFQQKARQSRELSGQPQAAMQGSLPGGGRIRSVYNNGQESLYVRLNPVGGEEPIPVDEPRYSPPPVPHLAIDILFSSQRYTIADVYSQSGSGAEGDDGDYLTWSRVSLVPTPRAIIAGGYPASLDYFIDDGHGGSTLKHDGRLERAAGSEIVLWGDDSNVFGVLGNADTSFDDLQFALAHEGVQGGLITDISDPSEVTQHDALVATITGSSAGRLTATWAIVYERATYTWVYPSGTPLGDHPTSGESVDMVEFYWRTNSSMRAHDTIDSFNVVNVAGLVGDPEEKPYEVNSVARSADDRFVRAVDLSAIQTIQRTVPATDEEALDGVTGIGFLAKPFKEVIPGEQSPDPTIIDVYIATDNNQRVNDSPGLVGSTTDADDASMRYNTPDGSLTFRIRAREYTYEAVGAVKVDTAIGQKKQHSTFSPTVVGPDVFSIRAERERDWAFAAVKGWTDLGGEPADPSADGMGKKLDDTAIVDHDAGQAPEDRKIFDQPEWTKAVTEMVKVARITWHPSTTPGINGTAEIELV